MSSPDFLRMGYLRPRGVPVAGAGAVSREALTMAPPPGNATGWVGCEAGGRGGSTAAAGADGVAGGTEGLPGLTAFLGAGGAGLGAALGAGAESDAAE